MADFKAALKTGLSAALEAEKRRNEVKQILTELNNQIHEETDKKITICLGSSDQYTRIPAIRGKNPPENALIAQSSGKNPRQRILSSWEQAKSGYPCTITVGKKVFSCEDKYALENCLTELLQDAEVGEKIHALMQPDAA